MSHPSRAHGSDPLEPPFPEEGGSGRGGTVVDPLDKFASDEDLAPTGEHSPPMALHSGDLVPEEDSIPTAAEPGPVRRRAPPAPQTHNLAMAHTEPPERRDSDPAVAEEDLVLSPQPSDVGLPPDLDGEGELEAAPTRIEREQDILGMEAAAAVPRLTIIGGNNRGKEFELKRGDNSIGRGVDNDVVLADIAVSRKHTLVCFEGDRFVVRDLGSGNGTLVNGERVESRVLEDGDQLELGNSLLRFNSPPAEAGALAQMATVITPRELIDGGAPVPAAKKGQRAVSTDPTPTVAARTGPLLSPRAMRLAIFGSVAVVVFLGAMVGVKAYLNAKKREAISRAAPKPDEILAQEFQEGITEFNAKNWEKARSHFLKVLALAPAQGHVRQYVDQAAAEIVARDAIERAKTRLTGLDYAGARQELSKVKAASSYRPDAEALGRKIDEQEVTSLLRAAKTLESSGDKQGALEKVKAAQSLAPDRSDVKTLYAALTAAPAKKVGKKTAKVEPPPRVTPKVSSSNPRAAVKTARTTKTVPKAAIKVATKETAAREPVRPVTKKDVEPPPVKVGGGAKAAMALYKRREWGPAYQAIKDWADTQKGKKQKAARALAENIRLVGQAWTRAEQVRQPAQSLRYYQDALAADARIEKSPHQKELKDLVVKTARGQATMALTRRRYADAFSAVKLAEKSGGKGDPGLQKVVQALQKQAEEIFNRAYTIRTSNLAQARRLWQEVLRMVPPTSAIYQKAYGWLNNSNPNYQDQDED